ncbi:MAG: hypothetical protein HY343_08420 [Lentisphaerae bacterium]|nr:hypothetical protein [Lentisphaerota bacterium]
MPTVYRFFQRRSFILGLALGLGFVAAQPGFSAQFLETNAYSLAENEVLTQELWLAASHAEFKGTASNDLFLLVNRAANLTPPEAKPEQAPDVDLRLDGAFANDVWAIGTAIELSGQVRDHARLMAETLFVSGSVLNGSMLAGKIVHIKPSAQLRNGSLIAGSTVTLEGTVQGDLSVFGDAIALSGSYEGDVFVAGRNIHVLPGTEIAGNLTYQSDSELVLDKRVRLQGRLIRQALPPATDSSLLSELLYYLAALLIGALFIGLFPGLSFSAIPHIRFAFWKSVMIGMLVLCVLPLAGFFFVLIFAFKPVIGMSVGLAATALFISLIYLGKIMVSLTLGAALTQQNPPTRFGGSLWRLAIGSACFYLVANIHPLLGWLVGALAACAGAGGLVTAFHSRAAPLAVPVVPPPLPNSPL